MPGKRRVCITPEHQAVVRLEVTGRCGEQQPLSHLQKALIKVLLVVVPIIAELHRQTNYHCFQNVIPCGGGRGKEEVLLAITVIAVITVKALAVCHSGQGQTEHMPHSVAWFWCRMVVKMCLGLE